MEFTFVMVKMDAQALEGSAGIVNMNVSGDTFMYHAKKLFPYCINGHEICHDGIRWCPDCKDANKPRMRRYK